MLEAQNISKSYGGAGGDLCVLRDASLRLEKGASASIMGPSGCGKSTLLNILGTLEKPTGGMVRVEGRDPFSLKEVELAAFRNQSIGFVFQDHHLLPQCTVLENVLVPALVTDRGDVAVERAKALLDRVGLSGRLEHLPSELSGGERQRTAIARALVNQPAVVLADEPTGNLDRASADVVANLLSELHQAEQAILVVVTHSEELASRFDQQFKLVDGVLRPSSQS